MSEKKDNAMSNLFEGLDGGWEYIYNVMEDTPATIIKAIADSVLPLSLLWLLGAGKIRKEALARRKKLCDLILSGESFSVPSNLEADHSWIHELMKLIQTVERLSYNEKIKYYAYVYRHTFCTEERISFDSYEEFKHLISILSTRQILLLFKLVKRPQKMIFTEVEKWRINTSEDFRISVDELQEEYLRLQGLGLCIQIIGRTWGDYEKETTLDFDYKPTKYCEKFILCINEAEERGGFDE
jgi:calcineurin-like phosphoesterase family protein